MKYLPKISFVIPIHNRAHLILDALESLKNQTIEEWEAVVVDDHSTDKVEEVVKNYDPRVRYLKLPDNFGKGVSCARNFGNINAKAELIAVLDSDDLAKPNRAERAIKSYQKYKWDFYCARREIQGEMIGALTEQKVRPNKWDSELFKTQSYVTHSSVVYTKKAALEIPYNSALPALEDYDLVSRFIELKKNMYFDQTVTTIYRRHGGETITTSLATEFRLKILHFIRTMRGWKHDNPTYEIPSKEEKAK